MYTVTFIRLDHKPDEIGRSQIPYQPISRRRFGIISKYSVEKRAKTD